jgi:allophanate hydrolase subunit 1
LFKLETHSSKSLRLIPTEATDLSLFDLSDYLLSLGLEPIEDIIPTAAELMICLKSPLEHEQQTVISEKIKQFNANKINSIITPPLKLKAKVYRTKDLDRLLELKDISITHFITLLNASKYQLNMFGFLPGFMYIDGLNPGLAMPRKESPSIQCPQNAVAIGGEYLGIYKYPSPAGWHIIGTIDQLPNLEELHKVQRGSSININFSYESKD